MAPEEDPQQRSDEERRRFAEERRRLEQDDDAPERGDDPLEKRTADDGPDERAVRDARRRVEPDDA